jgi:hypothetical protein
MATLNTMMFFYGLYLVRVLIGLIQFFRPIIRNIEFQQYSTSTYIEPIIRMGGMVFLPFFFLIPRYRKNILFTVLLCGYTFWNYTFSYWSVLAISLKILFCISIFAATYAVLWLFEKLPSQTEVI